MKLPRPLIIFAAVIALFFGLVDTYYRSHLTSKIKELAEVQVEFGFIHPTLEWPLRLRAHGLALRKFEANDTVFFSPMILLAPDFSVVEVANPRFGAVNISDGRLTVRKSADASTLDVQLDGKLGDERGALAVLAQAKIDGDSPSVTGTAELKDIEIDRVLGALNERLVDLLRGRANGKFEFSFAGKTKEVILDQIKGSGDLELSEGKWSTLKFISEFGEQLRTLPGAAERLKNLRATENIKRAKAELLVADRTVTIKTATVETAESNVTLQLGGYVKFDSELFLKGSAMFPAGDVPPSVRASDGRARLPIEVGGTLENPKANWALTIGVAGKAWINQGIKKLIDKAPEDIKKLLKGIKF